MERSGNGYCTMQHCDRGWLGRVKKGQPLASSIDASGPGRRKDVSFATGAFFWC